MNKFHIYEQLAQYYDLVYSRKNYKKEATALIKIIKKHKQSSGKELLEVACGTGRHLSYFKKYFRVTGTDLHPAMLKIARSRNRGVTVQQADMFSLNLKKKFDVVLCLFNGIGYAKTEERLQKVMRNFAKHLAPGGVVIVETRISGQSYKSGGPHLVTFDGEDIKIARLYVSQRKGNISILELHYLIAERNKKVRYIVDRHELALFTAQQLQRAMGSVGLRAMYVHDRAFKHSGIFIGVAGA